jgi:hypothetical protein
MNLTWNILKRAGRRQAENTAIEKSLDPLDHPDLRRMTLAELADLPMPVYTRENCTC